MPIKKMIAKSKPGITPKKYNKEAMRTGKKLIKTRVKQWKANKNK
jgi:hypothetical protein